MKIRLRIVVNWKLYKSVTVLKIAIKFVYLIVNFEVFLFWKKSWHKIIFKDHLKQ